VRIKQDSGVMREHGSYALPAYFDPKWNRSGSFAIICTVRMEMAGPDLNMSKICS